MHPYLEGGIPQHVEEHREQVDLGSIIALQINQSAHTMSIPCVGANAQSFVIQGVRQLALHAEGTSRSAQAVAPLGHSGCGSPQPTAVGHVTDGPPHRGRQARAWHLEALQHAL